MSNDFSIQLLPGTRVLACRVLLPELSALGLEPPQVIYLDQGLHRYPDDLRAHVADKLALLEQDPQVDQVVLGYGYCGGGLEGLTSRRVRLVFPLVHDCIPLLLDGPPPGVGPGQACTFYLSPGWVEQGRTPLSEYWDCCQRLGAEDALWVGQQMLKGYGQVILIRHPQTHKQAHVEYAKEMADLFGLSYGEVPGGFAWLRRLLAAQAAQGVAMAAPGCPLRLAMFPTSPLLPQSAPQADQEV